jgi:SynChlorMet cassette protein ScmC
MKSMRSISTSIEYALILGDGCSWRLSGIKDCMRLVARLAAIMELEEGRLNGSPKLVFCERGYINETTDAMIDAARSESSWSERGEGWHFCDHNTLRLWCHDNIADVVCEVKDIEGEEIEFINMWFSLQPVYQRSICKGGLPFHAGLAELDGQGIVLAAPGDKGKSTCCRRLPDYWQPLCDDETLVVLAQQKEYRAHPFPTWSDHLLKRSNGTWNVQYSVPLSGIFFLQQSETDEVEPVGEGQAALLITESATQICEKFWRNADEEDQKEFREELFNNACEMAKKIPAYRLRVSLKGRFWEKIEQVLG